jgi:hypothetical protein
LAELEMETRMALVPDGWEHPGQIGREERDQGAVAELDGL